MRAEFTSKNGFSVVAPTSTSTRSSTACKSASCWLRLKRWISSTNRMVRSPNPVRRFSAASISRRRSDTVPPIADTSTNAAFVLSAMTCASEVFPVPAGPNKMTELNRSCSMAARSQLPGPTASFWPTTSSSERGRIRTASGATSDFRSFSMSVNNVSMSGMVSCERLFAYTGFVEITQWFRKQFQNPEGTRLPRATPKRAAVVQPAMGKRMDMASVPCHALVPLRQRKTSMITPRIESAKLMRAVRATMIILRPSPFSCAALMSSPIFFTSFESGTSNKKDNTSKRRITLPTSFRSTIPKRTLKRPCCEEAPRSE